jgi:hypothetical protein
MIDLVLTQNNIAFCAAPSLSRSYFSSDDFVVSPDQFTYSSVPTLLYLKVEVLPVGTSRS